MTANKDVVARYQAALGSLDWATVSSCLADDVERVEWADGFPQSGVAVRGRAAVIEDMQAPRPFEIRTARATEENDVVVTECTVRVPLEGGKVFVGQCCTIYELKNGKIQRIASFVAENKHPA